MVSVGLSVCLLDHIKTGEKGDRKDRKEIGREDMGSGFKQNIIYAYKKFSKEKQFLKAHVVSEGHTYLQWYE